MGQKFVLYHGNCYDGFGAALAAWLKFGKDATYVASVYGTKPPEMPEDAEVYMLDFSYKRAVLLELLPKIGSLTIIDHHKTAEEDLKDLKKDAGDKPVEVVFDMEKSGALLAYEYFHGSDVIPKLFPYLSDRDLWKFELPRSKEINAFIKSHPYDFDEWKKIMDLLDEPAAFDAAALSGTYVLKFQQRTVEMMCDQARMEKIGEHTVPVVNSTGFWGEIGEELLKRYPDALFGASYFDRKDGRRQYSLRCAGEKFDVSTVAKSFGGGGHKEAAGYDVEIPDLKIAKLEEEKEKLTNAVHSMSMHVVDLTQKR